MPARSILDWIGIDPEVIAMGSLQMMLSSNATARLDLDTIPSFGPRTAARSQPIRCARCRSRCRVPCLAVVSGLRFW